MRRMTVSAAASRRAASLKAAPARAAARRDVAPRIERVDPLHADAQGLLAQAALDLQPLYPALFGPGLPPPTNLPALPRSAYLLAYVGTVAAGSAALHPLSDTLAEVRRVYVPPAWRRRGVASALMVALEDEARALGYGVLRLETGARQSAALTLYQGLGWRRIPPFGVYADEPGCACFEKAL